MTSKYGTIHYTGARVGDNVRFVPNPTVGQPGAIFLAPNSTTASGTLQRVQGSIGYVEVRSTTPTQVVAEGGGASGIRLHLPVTVRGSLRVL